MFIHIVNKVTVQIRAIYVSVFTSKININLSCETLAKLFLQNWHRVDQQKVDAAFGVETGQWEAYWEERTDRKMNNYKYISPSGKSYR